MDSNWTGCHKQLRALECHPEIKRSEWMVQVTRLLLTNQNGLSAPGADIIIFLENR